MTGGRLAVGTALSRRRGRHETALCLKRPGTPGGPFLCRGIAASPGAGLCGKGPEVAGRGATGGCVCLRCVFLRGGACPAARFSEAFFFYEHEARPVCGQAPAASAFFRHTTRGKEARFPQRRESRLVAQKARREKAPERNVFLRKKRGKPGLFAASAGRTAAGHGGAAGRACGRRKTPAGESSDRRFFSGKGSGDALSLPIFRGVRGYGRLWRRPSGASDGC